PLVPQDILRVSGEEAVQQYLTRAVQKVYRSKNVKINDKHIEIIVSQMLRKVQVEDPGDTDLLEGQMCDKFEFRRKNKELENSLKITDAGDTSLTVGELVPRDYVASMNAEMEADGKRPAAGVAPQPAIGSTQLLGISKAAVQSPSFISAASFQETTKVLTEAALAGKVDHLIGLKENVILGHLIPAGTGFRAYQEAECAQAGCENDLEAPTLDTLAPDEEEDFALLKDRPLEDLLNEAEEPKTEE
ncbi:MAG: DNA-directed RNA polymerase subunit beta', partial [Thermoguttaceae bacterium]|nr:DNA-directed RNA polymerase subunit beta' [Thermoguttaceae bacterium]